MAGQRTQRSGARQAQLLQQLRPRLAAVSAVVEAEVEAATRSLIGSPVEALDTPALFIDVAAVENNIAQMSEQIRATGAIWRPHTKAIRSPELAKKLVDGGAVGVTCAKISQAAALVNGGVRDVLIANEIVGPAKVAALVKLSKKCDRLTVACDNEDNLRAISAEAVAQNAQMSVYVDLNVGMNRCGIHWCEHADWPCLMIRLRTCAAELRRVRRSKKDEIVMMAKLADSLPNIEFRGLMGYDGHAQGNTDKRVQQTQDSSDRLFAAKGWVEAAGVKVQLLSGAGSGNYWEAIKGSTNEIQAGGGVLFCMNYADSHNVEGQAGKFQFALKMQIQIISIAGVAPPQALRALSLSLWACVGVCARACERACMCARACV